MVERDSTRKSVLPRETEQGSGGSGNTGPAQAESALALYERAMEAAHNRLMKGRAVLECLVFTLSYRREVTEREVQLESGDIALVAEVVRDLVNDSLRKLDSPDIVRAIQKRIAETGVKGGA